MDVFSATAAVLRRWYIALPILLITGYLAVQQYQSVEPTYSASASVVLLPPPPRAPSPEITDPEDLQTPLDPAIAGIGKSSRLISGLVERNLENPVVRDRLQALGATASYSVGVNKDLSLLSFEVTGADPVVTEATLGNVIAASGAVLDQVQRDLGATTDAVYRQQIAAPPLPPEEVIPERNRAVIATVVGGAALAFFLALLFDSAMAALASRRRQSGLGSEAPGQAVSGGSAEAPSPGSRRLSMADSSSGADSTGARPRSQPDAEAPRRASVRD